MFFVLLLSNVIGGLELRSFHEMAGLRAAQGKNTTVGEIADDIVMVMLF